MAIAVVGSSLLRSVVRARPRSSAAPRRNFASSSHHDDEYETAKWEKITYLGITTCTVLSIYNLSKGHHHHDEPPVRMAFSKRKSITRNLWWFPQRYCVTDVLIIFRPMSKFHKIHAYCFTNCGVEFAIGQTILFCHASFSHLDLK